jgi:hypothetical protein
MPHERKTGTSEQGPCTFVGGEQRESPIVDLAALAGAVLPANKRGRLLMASFFEPEIIVNFLASPGRRPFCFTTKETDHGRRPGMAASPLATHRGTRISLLAPCRLCTTCGRSERLRREPPVRSGDRQRLGGCGVVSARREHMGRLATRSIAQRYARRSLTGRSGLNARIRRAPGPRRVPASIQWEAWRVLAHWSRSFAPFHHAAVCRPVDSWAASIGHGVGLSKGRTG